MKILQYYAEWMEKCPKCGSTEFHELYTGENEDEYLIGLVCKHCRQSYPTKEHFIKTQRDTNPVACWLHKTNIPY